MRAARHALRAPSDTVRSGQLSGERAVPAPLQPARRAARPPEGLKPVPRDSRRRGGLSTTTGEGILIGACVGGVLVHTLVCCAWGFVSNAFD